MHSCGEKHSGRLGTVASFFCACRVWPWRTVRVPSSLGSGPSSPAHQHPLGTEAAACSEDWRWDLGLVVLISGKPERVWAEKSGFPLKTLFSLCSSGDSLFL